MPDPRHPLPPVVRWIVAPAFLVMAGAAAGGIIALSETSARDRVDVMMIAIGFSAGGSFGVAVSRTPWVMALAASILGLPFMAVADSVYLHRWAALSLNPLQWILSHSDAIPSILMALVGLAVAHGVYLRGPRTRWILPVALYVAGGLAWTLWLVFSLNKREGAPWIVVFGVLLGGSQLSALVLARALAERLDRRASAR